MQNMSAMNNCRGRTLSLPFATPSPPGAITSRELGANIIVNTCIQVTDADPSPRLSAVRYQPPSLMHPPERMTNVFLQLSYVIFKVLGLAPFTIRTSSTSRQSPRFACSRVGAAYNIILVVIVMILSPSSIIAIETVDYTGKTSTTRVIVLTKVVLGLSVLVIVWLYVALTQRSATRIANVWRQVAETMRALTYIRHRSSSEIRLPLYLALNLCIWINIFWSDLLEFEKWFKATFVGIIIPSFIFTWLILQYTFVLALLGDRFRALNEGLHRISSTAFVAPYYCASSENTLDDVIAKDVLMIKGCHEVLYELACDISSLYAFPILLVISVLCATIIYSSYYFFMALLLTDHLEPLIILNSMCYILMETFPIVVLSFGVSKVLNEMKLTPVATHKLLARSFIKPELKSQLKLFSLELLHRNVSFTGGNIFSLDGTLLHSILNTTATYLIILFQFAQSDRSAVSSSRMTDGSSGKSPDNLTDSLAATADVNDEL